MLDSMIHNPRPTRAEVSDIANAVIDHADAVMLSGETATGKYPLEAVSTMAKIAEETEASHFDDVSLKEGMALAAMVSDSVGGAAALMAETMHAKVILVGTMSGQTAQMVSRFRPELPIVVAAPTDFVRRQINLSWAVYPIVVSGAKKRSDLVKRSITKLRQAKVVKSRDKIITVTSPPSSEPANLVEVVEV
jgi:pyruvate kinase